MTLQWRQNHQRYYAVNREQLREKVTAYRDANREKIYEQQRTSYYANHKRILERRQAKREANQEQFTKNNRIYREANRELLIGRDRERYREKKLSYKVLKQLGAIPEHVRSHKKKLEFSYKLIKQHFPEALPASRQKEKDHD